MTISEGKNTGPTGQYDGEILDQEMIQLLQESFCSADQVYCLCMSKSKESVTELHGSPRECDWINAHLDLEQYRGFWHQLLGSGIENVVEQKTPYPYVKVCALAIRLSDKTEAVWLMIGFLEEYITKADQVPSYMMTTTEERYYKSLKLLETLSRQYFSAKLGELMLIKEFHKTREAKRVTELELERSIAMTNVVRMLESEKDFLTIIQEILVQVSVYLNTSDATLVCWRKEWEKPKVVCAHGKDEHNRELEWEECPYFNGKPYMISSDSMMTEAFERLFKKDKIQAAVYLPIEVSSEFMLYINFYQREEERNWDMAEIKFLNDVKRIVQSIVMRRMAQESLEVSHASLEAILENTGCGIYVRDPKDNTVLYINRCYKELFPEEEQTEEQQKILLEEEICTEYYSKGQHRWFDVHGSKIHWMDGRSVMLYTIYEVTDKNLYQQKIERQANNDFLTGLYNRMRCENDLQMFIDRTKENGGTGALLYMDLDDFKHINDGLGHQYGDVLLQGVSKRLKTIPEIQDSCYRMGGDEFIIIVTENHYAKLQHIIDEIADIFVKPWFLRDGEYYSTMSMGVVRFPIDGVQVEELIRKADIAMYQAKRSGKNRIEYYDERVSALSLQRLDMEKKMRNATMNSCKEFKVHFQPIMGIDEKCQGAEALLRWSSDGMGLMSPAEFIPLAEYLGLIHPIGEYVLEEACRHLKYWNEMGHPDYQVNVNLSVLQLLQNDIVSKVKKVIDDYRIIPRNLVLEVTESLAINDMNRVKGILQEIKQLGVRVALDDFGTGYSSLNHVREMPIDTIKIDRCFVSDIGKDDFSESFIKMVAELATTIGVCVCVEGVETEEQYKVLSHMQIQQMQGFYYDEPLPAEKFEKKYVGI